MIKLMYITNECNVARIADIYGVDRIFIDLEVNGKEERQKGLDTVKSKHKIVDIGKIKKILKNAELLVRINPIYKKSKEEIDSVIKQGADIIMLPFFKKTDEVRTFINLVNRRCKTMLLVETPEAVKAIDEILEIDGIDEIHIGLNDLHLGYGMKFMFELLADGTVEKLISKFKNKNIPYGFGGIGKIGMGTLPAEHILTEHYRLGSKFVILSRSFCNMAEVKNKEGVDEVFKIGIKDLRVAEERIAKYTKEQFEENRKKVIREVQEIVSNIKNKE